LKKQHDHGAAGWIRMEKEEEGWGRRRRRRRKEDGVRGR
jgi:hypothetical protein